MQQGIEHVDSIIALGIVVSNRLTAADHISCILTVCSSLLYTLVCFAVMVYLSHLWRMCSRPQYSPRSLTTTCVVQFLYHRWSWWTWLLRTSLC